MPQQFSLLIPVYNEGEKLRELMQDIQRELKLLSDFKLDKICIVASGDSQETKELVKDCDLPVVFTVEERRRGKAKAINQGLKHIESDLIVLVSGDLSLGTNTLPKVLEEFSDKEVGVVTGRPIPQESQQGFVSYFKTLVWNIHHYLSQVEPKAGEIVGLRNEIRGIPEKTAADEELIKSLMLGKGYKTVYQEEARVYNEGPKGARNLFKQRERISIGHLDLKERTGYISPSLGPYSLAQVLYYYLKDHRPNYLFLSCLWFELVARMSSLFKYYLLHRLWDKNRN